MGVLGGGDDDRVEVVGLVEDAPEIVERFGLREPLGGGVERVLVDVAEHDDVLVGMRGAGAFVARRVRHEASCPA